MKRILRLLGIMLTLCVLSAHAQRTTDKLDRGLVAVPSGSGSFVSWRIFGEEYYDTQYNLYRNGTKVNAQPLNVSNYTDPQGTAGSRYQVAAVVRGVEQEKCAEVSRQSSQYLQFTVKPIYSRRGTNITKAKAFHQIQINNRNNGVNYYVEYTGQKTVYQYDTIQHYNVQTTIDVTCPEMVSFNGVNYNSLEYHNELTQFQKITLSE